MIIRRMKWAPGRALNNILAIRLQAMGDVVITLPYLQSLAKRYPNAKVDFLTRKETREIPEQIHLFDRVYAIGGARNFKLQLAHALLVLPRLMRQRYDVVLDLQNNEISRLVRRGLRPSSWSEFDRVSPLPAGERTRATIEASGLGPIEMICGVRLKSAALGMDLLRKAGWQPATHLVVLNPAGLYPTRNWPLDNYVQFARLWRENFGEPTRFLLLGLGPLASRAGYLRERIGASVIDLVSRTTAAEAIAILQKATLVLSEDSGLMHMAWIAGVPTLALFGSSRGDWSRPLGRHSHCLHSGDLPCGFCLEAVCRHADNHCLARYEPGEVFRLAIALVTRARARNGVA